jgi:hypothetical protein
MHAAVPCVFLAVRIVSGIEPVVQFVWLGKGSTVCVSLGARVRIKYVQMHATTDLHHRLSGLIRVRNVWLID